jgi:hypothetical protein
LAIPPNCLRQIGQYLSGNQKKNVRPSAISCHQLKHFQLLGKYMNVINHQQRRKFESLLSVYGLRQKVQLRAGIGQPNDSTIQVSHQFFDQVSFSSSCCTQNEAVA